MELSLTSAFIWLMIVFVGYGILVGVKAKWLKFLIVCIIVFSFASSL